MAADPAADPYTALGAYLTGFEAEQIAAVLAAGDTTSQALKEVNPTRRVEAKRLLAAAGLGHHQVETSVAVLRAIAGARSIRATLTPVWTMPGSEATTGRLTGQMRSLIDDARMSVVCSSYNFTPYSQMWAALRDAAQRPGVSVTLYLDADKGTPQQVAATMPGATVYRTATPAGATKPLVSHAKFIIIDRALVLLTSANFSHSAEHTNIELGLLVHDAALAASIESTMRGKHGTLYERAEAS
ncbi:MAG: DISARM system phospholipase D-like protein DrmC [Micromonosporaceae bacterium]|nr:DISARM system phospholipase D-like protein DrmC [Micromonosporaceae bacterium]